MSQKIFIQTEITAHRRKCIHKFVVCRLHLFRFQWCAIRENKTLPVVLIRFCIFQSLVIWNWNMQFSFAFVIFDFYFIRWEIILKFYAIIQNWENRIARYGFWLWLMEYWIFCSLNFPLTKKYWFHYDCSNWISIDRNIYFVFAHQFFVIWIFLQKIIGCDCGIEFPVLCTKIMLKEFMSVSREL